MILYVGHARLKMGRGLLCRPRFWNMFYFMLLLDLCLRVECIWSNLHVFGSGHAFLQKNHVGGHMKS